MLTQKIRTDMLAAMRAKDSLRLDTLRGAMAAFTNELVSKGRRPTEELYDPEVITVLKRLAKQRKDSADQFAAGGRDDLFSKEMKELKIIEEYLPPSVPREEIEKVARAKMAELGITAVATAGLSAQTGKLIGAVMKEFAGRADGEDVKAVIAAIVLEKM